MLFIEPILMEKTNSSKGSVTLYLKNSVFFFIGLIVLKLGIGGPTAKTVKES